MPVSPTAEAVAGLSPAAASAREQVLGAALNLVAKCPEKCTDAHGFVNGEAVAALIAAQSARWFDAPTPPLSNTEMAQLIDRWLE
jgi:hypothetical protein